MKYATALLASTIVLFALSSCGPQQSGTAKTTETPTTARPEADPKTKAEQASYVFLAMIHLSKAIEKVQPTAFGDMKAAKMQALSVYQDCTTSELQDAVSKSPQDFQEAYESFTKAQLAHYRSLAAVPDSMLSVAADLVGAGAHTNRKYDDLKSAIERAQADLETSMLALMQKGKKYTGQ